MEFEAVLDVLRFHGDEIMMGLYGNKARKELMEDEGFDEDMMFYDCYTGGDFFPELFGIKNFSSCRELQNIDPPTKPFKEDFVYFCMIKTFSDENNYAVDQVHYFTIVMGKNRTILLQTYGGVRKVLVKTIVGDITKYMEMINQGNTGIYDKLFEVPEWMKHVLNFKSISFRYKRFPLKYPTLFDLNEIIKDAGLDFAKNAREKFL
tara:strand:+ start:2840 stop:3457 length:618 start_codon:yes stop_codon:yes gene_type:complete